MFVYAIYRSFEACLLNGDGLQMRKTRNKNTYVYVENLLSQKMTSQNPLKWHFIVLLLFINFLTHQSFMVIANGFYRPTYSLHKLTRLSYLTFTVSLELLFFNLVTKTRMILARNKRLIWKSKIWWHKLWYDSVIAKRGLTVISVSLGPSTMKYE